jgi:hypothetical protein
MDNRLRIYSDKSWLPVGKKHVIMLYPFWGDIPLPADDPDFGRFDEYMQSGKEIFEMVNDLPSCNIAVLPFEYAFDEESKSVAHKANIAAKEKGKKLLVFYNSDDPSPINLDNSIILRTSFLSSTRNHNEFAFPGWSVDFLKQYSEGKLNPLRKQTYPEVSYCGYVDSTEESTLSIKARFQKFFAKPAEDFYAKGAAVRGKAVRQLQHDKNVKYNFIIRQGFWAEGLTDKKAARKQYAENMFQSPYALVARGAGNFSYRLYEVMSCGRIPLFINTDCVLPYGNFIDWKKSCVWLEESEVGQISSKLVQFHNSISGEEFEAKQIANRKIYEEWLSPTGFFKNLKKLVIA